MRLKQANRFIIRGSLGILLCPTPSGATVSALVDSADILKVVTAAHWRAFKVSGEDRFTYICAKIKNKLVYLHRFVTDAPKGMVVDHANHRGTDNRRANLRVVTACRNMLNRRTVKASSGYRGVTQRGLKRFHARYRFEGKEHFLGSFPTAELAAAAVREALAAYGVKA